MYKYYLVTIKTRGTVYTTPKMLYDFFEKMKQDMRLTEWSDLRVLERTDCSRLHFHSVVITQDNIFRIMKMNNKKNIYAHFQEFPHSDYDRVREYLLKQVPDWETQMYLMDQNLFENENVVSNLHKIDELRQFNRHPIRPLLVN